MFREYLKNANCCILEDHQELKVLDVSIILLIGILFVQNSRDG